MINEIKKELSILTKDFSKSDKIKLLLTLGYDSFTEIEKLDDEGKKRLLKRLQEMKDAEYILCEFGDLIITRKKHPRSVKDVSFTYKSLKNIKEE